MGLTEDVDKIKKYIAMQEANQASKDEKEPFGKKVGKSQKKRNFVSVMILHENGNVDWKKYQIEDQTIMHDSIPRLAGAGYVMYHKKNPMLILPNWSVEPISTLEYYNKSLINGNNTAGYKILMNKMLKSQVTDKPKMGGWVKWVAGLALVGIIAYAFISGGGGK